MSNGNYSEKMVNVRERTKNERPEDNEKPGVATSNAQAVKNIKFCPFRECKKPCDPNCMLHRPEKKGFECYFMELQSISWWLSKKFKK